MKKTLILTVAAMTMAFAMSACSGGSKDAPVGDSGEHAEISAASGEKTVIRFFSKQPDRTTGQGLVEQMIMDQYMKENPNIDIQVETLDDSAYKIKFKAYAASSEMPDIVNVWGQPAFINEVIDAGLLAELDPAVYQEYGFIEGSLAGFSKDGKLYGLPRNSDVMAFFYNKKIFDDNGWSVPQTFDELLNLCSEINEKGIIPVSISGADKWPMSIFITDAIAKYYGPGAMDITAKAVAEKDFSDEAFVKAAQLLKDSVDAGMFQTGFETSDFGSALNLFANGQAAMLYTGSWDMSMANNMDIAPEIRDNIRAFSMPVVSGGKGAVTDIAAWNGGGFSVTSGSKVKDEAIKFLNYMYLPENWNRIAWEQNVCMSAQDFSQYKTGNETPVQLEFIEILTKSTSVSGTPINDLGDSEYKTRSEDASQELAVSILTVEEFLKKLEE